MGFRLNNFGVPQVYESVLTSLSQKVVQNVPTEVFQTNYDDLIEKYSLVKFSQLGTPVLDHITLYIDDMQQDSTNGVRNEKNGRNIFQNIGDNVTAAAKYTKQEWKIRTAKFKKLFGSNYQVLSAVSLDFNVIVSRPIKVIETSVPGLDQTVNTIVNNGNYNLTFDCLIVGGEFNQDVNTIEKFNLLFSMKVPLKISSTYLNNQFDIRQIIVKEYSFEIVKEYVNTVKLTFSAVSHSDKKIICEKLKFSIGDNPVELKK